MLDRDLDVGEALVLQDLHLRKGALDQRLGSGAAVAGDDAPVERAGVGPHADGHPPGGRLADDGADLPAVTDVAGIQPQSLHPRLECHEGEAVGEVDVGDDGDTRLGDDRRQRPGVALVGHRHTDDVRPLGGEGVDLDQGSSDILGLGDGHRLDGDRRALTDVDGAEADAPGEAACTGHAGLSVHYGHR